jgi:gamma-glutamyltranspeptidase/glutathione hydrolase
MAARAAGQVSTAWGKGAIASASRQASELAIQVLKDGGNAFDAAFATAFSLCIYHPQAGNLGGGGYLLFQAKGARPKVFNYREQAPMGAPQAGFLRPDGSVDPDKTSFGPTSVCVPGTVKAFFELQRRHGKLKPGDLLLAVAQRARDGAIVTQYEADCLNRLGPKLAASPEARRLYVRAEPFQAGDTLPNAALAETLTVLAREGEQAFYRGSIAEQLVTDLQAHGGFLAAEDLADYAIREADPISVEVAGRQVWTVPPEGGGAMLLEILSILDQEAFRHCDYGSPDYYHYLAQASKLAFIDRMDYLGDIPPGSSYRQLLTRESADRRFDRINPFCDTPTVALAAGLKTAGKNTTHFAIIDADGNAVSNSYTLNLRYGSKWAVAGAGFLLNGSIDSFSFIEGKENYFGVIGSTPNLFAPGKRPASNMAPVLVTSGAAVEMVLGTPGGPTIPTTLANMLAATLIHGVDPEPLVRASRLHHQGWPDTLYHEPGFDRPDLLAAMASMGYLVKDKQELISDVHGVFKRGEHVQSVSDYRREGLALAYPG